MIEIEININAYKFRLTEKILRIIIVDNKKANEPSKVLPLYIFVFPYLIPIRAAKESEMLIINKEDMIIEIS